VDESLNKVRRPVRGWPRWPRPHVRARSVRHVFHKVVRLALILASGSQIRHAMLTAAGVDHRVVRPDVDESAVKERLNLAEGIAVELAGAKALAVSAANPDDWVIGSDSVVGVGDRLFDKPLSRQQAAEHLRFFSGKSMRLTSAAALAHHDSVDWSHVETAELHMRPLSETFIGAYLDAEWPEVGYCVGVFRMEGRGVQLFSTIKGDHFTILGMPLLPLLGALRERKLLPS
jgi:septum formation protein